MVGWLVGWLVFYGISILVGYLIPNPVFISTYVCVCVCMCVYDLIVNRLLMINSDFIQRQIIQFNINHFFLHTIKLLQVFLSNNISFIWYQSFSAHR